MGGIETISPEAICDEFDSTKSYLVGDYVMKDGFLYKCTIAHTGIWNTSDFEQTSVMTIISFIPSGGTSGSTFSVINKPSLQDITDTITEIWG